MRWLYYDRIFVIMSKNGEDVEATQLNLTGLKASKEYLAHLLKGCDLLSKEYCEKLEIWEMLD